MVYFLYIASPQQGDLRFSDPPSGLGRRWRGLNPRQKGPCRSLGGHASHCATDAPTNGEEKVSKLCYLMLSATNTGATTFPANTPGLEAIFSSTSDECTLWDWILYIASPQQAYLRLPHLTSGQGAGSGARIRDRKVLAVLRADSLSTLPPTPRIL
ncbi:hypothetical protein PoB_000764000 [Plakobranchus ocellatus]|uniref:Uncharacterized protein n=1 Tax=Plakobranchus ocellatus TaxID=259542 RepID=A0AAV3YEF8_9GAST|nr:hypothetical protein PoB_000764000 [Plakobranchus ocellatus]